MRHRKGAAVEVMCSDIDARRDVRPHWERAIYLDTTSAGFMRVNWSRNGKPTLRAFRPEHVRPAKS